MTFDEYTGFEPDSWGYEISEEVWDDRQKEIESLKDENKILINAMNAELKRTGGTVPILVDALKIIGKYERIT